MFSEGFPIGLKEDVSHIMNLIKRNISNNDNYGKSESTIEYFQQDDVIKFPYRIYYSDNSDEFINSLDEKQKMILHCIFTRSCDGFVRQKHMNLLLLMDYKDWAIPYIVKICDEYVIEILEIIYDILKQQDTERIKNFCTQNSDVFYKSYNRMISYWNEYYRYQNKDFQQYVGSKIFVDCFGYSNLTQRKNYITKYKERT